jgi:hypothetical protein
MPDSIHQKTDHWSCCSKQNGQLTFTDQNNTPFAWDEGYEMMTLIGNNTIEPPAAQFPDISVKMPGVDLEHNIPTVTSDPEQLLQNSPIPLL